MKVNELAPRAGLNRGTLARVEDGHPAVRSTTFGAVEGALDRLEQETGISDEPGERHGWVKATVTGNFGVQAVFEGRPEDVGPLVRELFANLDEGEQSTEPAEVDPDAYQAFRRGARLPRKNRGNGEAGTDQPSQV